MKPFRLARRSFLRAAGVSISLPWLEAMVKHEARAAAATPRRFAAVFFGNGVFANGLPGSNDNYWHCTPGSTDLNWTLSRTLAPLAKHKALITYFHGLDPRDLRLNLDGHWAPAASFLTGLRHNSNAEGGGERLYRPLPLGSLDQAIANVLGSPSLNMAPFPVAHPPGSSTTASRGAGVFLTNISWKSQTQVAPRHDTSWGVFDAIFKSAPSGPPLPPSTLVQLRAAQKSMLDLVHGQAKSLQGRLGASDREKMGHYLTGIREVEQNIAAEANNPVPPASCNALVRDAFNDGPGRVHLDVGNKNMADLIALAFQCNRTQVATWMIDGEHNFDRMSARIPGYTGPAAGDDGHIISHHQGADRTQALITMNDWHVKKFLYLCDKLAAAPREANGKTILENSVLMFGTGMGDGNRHGTYEVNVNKPGYLGMAKILVGNGDGLFQAGRYIDANHAHHANLLLALARKFGVATDKFGNSDGVLGL